VAALFAPLYAPARGLAAGLVIAIAGAVLVVRAAGLLRAVDVRAFKLRFMEINTFALLVMVTLVADRLA